MKNLEDIKTVDDVSIGQFKAFIQKIGGLENFKKFLRDELELNFSEKDAVVVAAIKKLFDKTGRRIKPKDLKASICDPNKNYYVKQPAVIDYSDRLYRGFEKTGLLSCMSAADFTDEAIALINEVNNDKQYKDLLNGPYLPIIIPKSKLTDLGAMTEELVGAAEKAYKKQFPNRPFTNYRKNDLKGKVSIIPGSRYEQLLNKIKDESVVGIYFPTALQGYSVDAQREQMSTMPERFILSGPLDTAMAFTMYSDVLGRDGSTPVYDCSAVQWQSSESSLNFSADDDYACFGYRARLSPAFVRSSGGLLFVKG